MLNVSAGNQFVFTIFIPEGSNVQLIVPVVLVLVILFGCAVAIAIYIRYFDNSDSEDLSVYIRLN